MKSAEEIANESRAYETWTPHSDCSCECECCGLEWEAKYVEWIKQIQLDAYKAGMTRAAEIRDCLGVSTVRHAILTERDQLNEIPLQ